MAQFHWASPQTLLKLTPNCSSLGFKSPQVLRLSPGVGVFFPRRPNSSGTFRSS